MVSIDQEYIEGDIAFLNKLFNDKLLPKINGEP